jgi:hypothetical protein
MTANNTVIHHHSKRSVAVCVVRSSKTGEVGIYIVILDQRGLKLGFSNWATFEAGNKLTFAIGGITLYSKLLFTKLVIIIYFLIIGPLYQELD